MAVGKTLGALFAGVVVLVATAPAVFSAESEINTVLAGDGRIAAVQVSGLDAERVARVTSDGAWTEYFEVYVGDARPTRKDARPAVAGSYIVDGGSVRFEPLFPFASDLEFFAVFKQWRFNENEEGSIRLELGFRTPAAKHEGVTYVEQVFPSATQWPQNPLNLYIQFSDVMKQGQSYEHIRLVDNTTGETVEQAFVETRPELWSPDGTRLTLIFHPGRLKQGLKLRELSGPPIVEGRSYTLLVDGAMQDVNGQPLAATHQRVFVVGPDDRISPNEAKWQVTAPAAQSTDPLVLTFDEPMDRALLDRFVRVLTANEEVVQGRISVDDDERVWRYTPYEAWPPGAYIVVVSRHIQDLAGNSPKRTFEMPAGTTTEFEKQDPLIRLPVEVR